MEAARLILVSGAFMKKPSTIRLVMGSSVLALVSIYACLISLSVGDVEGGSGSVQESDHRAFGHIARNVDMQRWMEFRAGKLLFERAWPPSNRMAYFNSVSCNGCHIRDGRSLGPSSDTASVVLNLSIQGPPKLFRFTAAKLPPTGSWGVTWDTVKHEGLQCLRPRFQFKANPTLFPNTAFGVRTAPSMVGLGLLDLIPASQLQKWQQENLDAGGDVRGRIRYIRSQSGDRVPGKFGWKASEYSLSSQVRTAMLGELGIQVKAPNRNEPLPTSQKDFESGRMQRLSSEGLAAITTYLRYLAVPLRRSSNEVQVLVGERVFTRIGCENCHRQTAVTSLSPDYPELSGQTIHPFTDLLLHDMGPDLSDPQPSDGVHAAEWKTPALWGIGLYDTVNGPMRLLHDGRARSFEEAILWHGGEAEGARDRYLKLPSLMQRFLLKFLRSL